MDGAKVCPKCGSRTLMAYVKHGGIVESNGFDDNGNPIFKLMKENSSRYELEIIGCATCKAKLTETDLVGGIACKHCSRVVNPDDLDENGYCSMCSMLIKNPELEHASNDELLRLLAQAYRGLNPLNIKIDKRIEAAEAAEEMLQPNNNGGSTAADDILNGNVPADVQEAGKKTRRRAVRKKPVETEVVSETPVQDTPHAPQDDEDETGTQFPVEEINTAEEVLTDAQNAPFPEVAQEYQAPQPPIAEEQTTSTNTDSAPALSGGFQMFEGEEDSF